MSQRNGRWSLKEWTVTVTTVTTVGLFFIGWWGQCSTAKNMEETRSLMKDQLDEARRATNLSHRPFLLIEPVLTSCVLSYAMSEADSTVYRSLDSARFMSDDYLDVDSIRISYFGSFIRSNVGKTPTTFARRNTKGLTAREWVVRDGKDIDSLVSRILRRPDLMESELDHVLLPDVPDTSKLGVLGIRWISREELETAIKERRMVQYYFAYLEYKSVFNEVYNVIYMHHMIDHISVDSSGYVIYEPAKRMIQEKYRWDIQLDKVREFYKEQGL